MGGGVACDAGGILGLLALITEQREAVEYECIRLGHRLRDYPSPQHTWRDLWVIVRMAPADSPLARHMHPVETAWTASDYLMALAVDALNAANWQRGGKGQRPKPIPRPGETSSQRIGKPIPLDELKAKLERWHSRTESRPVDKRKLPPHLRGLASKM